MKSLDFCKWTGICLAMAGGLAAIVAASAISISEHRNRPETRIPEITRPVQDIAAPEKLDPTDSMHDSHYWPKPIKRPTPEPRPSLRIDETVRIRVLRQDAEPMLNLLLRDIQASGGEAKRPDDTRVIDSLVPQEYIQRAEPLLRRDHGHVNSSYVQWAKKTVGATTVGGRPNTEVKFVVIPRFFQDPEKARLVFRLYLAGTLTVLAAGAIAAASLIRPHLNMQGRQTAAQK